MNKYGKFHDEYPEFGLSDIIPESIKTCPCCYMLFNMWKEERIKRQRVKDAIYNVTEHEPNKLIIVTDFLLQLDLK